MRLHDGKTRAVTTRRIAKDTALTAVRNALMSMCIATHPSPVSRIEEGLRPQRLEFRPGEEVLGEICFPRAEALLEALGGGCGIARQKLRHPGVIPGFADLLVFLRRREQLG